MLRKILIGAGVFLLLAALLLILFHQYALLPHALIFGLMLSAGIVWERWQYKPPQTGAPDPQWRATGERFVDPQSGKTLEVYFDPRDGESHYVESPRS